MTDAIFSECECAFQQTLNEALKKNGRGSISTWELDLWADKFRRRLAVRVALVAPEPPPTVATRGEILHKVQLALFELERQLRAGVPWHVALVDCRDQIEERIQGRLFD